MNRLLFSLIILLFALPLQAQYRPAGSNYTPSEKAVLWTADSTAPFKVVGKSLQAVEIFDVPGKTKNELYNSVIDYFSNRYGQYLELFKDKDRESGRIAVAWTHDTDYIGVAYQISKSMMVDVKDEKIRITTNLNHLRFGVADYLEQKFNKRISVDLFDKDIADCYPLVPPAKKRPNDPEKKYKKVIAQELARAKEVTKELVEYVSKPSEDW